jgi:GNAT superfamily N-acetyltransferase
VAADGSAVSVRQLARSDAALLDQVQRQFADLYQVLEGYGLAAPLVPGGELLWRKGVEPLLGRLIGLTAAIDADERVLGFIHTTLVYLPDYLGGARAARLGHIYVADDARGFGLPARMWEVAEGWLRAAGATSVEVQAQAGNMPSRGLWPRLGFSEDVIQFRKSLAAAG